MKRIKKGFTLIELLAVIIVLAIVAVIAVPIALDVIQESKDSANKTTAYNIIDAAKLYYTESMFDIEKANNINNKNNIYKSITMSNEIPESGELYVNETGKIALSVVIDNKCYIKYFESELQIYDENDEKCNAYVSNDEIIPEVSFEIIGTLGENGWYKANSDGTDTLYVKIKVSDEGSGISYFNWCEGTACTPANKETILEKSISIQDTPNTQVCVEAYDNQGNTSGAVCSEEIKKDTQAPEITGIEDIELKKNEEIDLSAGVEANDTLSLLNGEYTYLPESIDTTQVGETEVVYTVRDKAGNVSTITRKITVIVTCEYEVGHEWEFNYSGSPEEYIVPCDGTYKLEVWGAQGGSVSVSNSSGDVTSATATGGYGGYAYGNKSLIKSTNIYVVVGGAGTSATSTGTSAAGGYNGGGTGASWSGTSVNAGGGGGATHIGLTNALLKNTEKSNILIVAGGGGGAFRRYNTLNQILNQCNGGTGGGTSGGSGMGLFEVKNSGGTQTSGFAFGYGSNGVQSSNSAGGGGGGGGLYGGGFTTQSSNYESSGSGGSGYIDGVTNGSMENGKRSGNGYARITLVSIN